MESVNAATPVVIGDKVLLTECYGPGAVLLDLKGGKPKVVWSDEEKDRFDKSLQCHWNTPIHVNGFVYASSGRHTEDATMRCVDLKTGDVKWEQPGFGAGNVILAGNHLVALSDDGHVAMVEATPSAYKELGRINALDGKCWSTPALSDGRVYLRSTKEGACLDFNASK
jgi:outer membrane protein assembly factor BamB